MLSINFGSLFAHAILGSVNLGLLEVKASLLHDDFEGTQVFFFKVNVRVGHVLVNGLGEQVNVTSSVSHHTFYEALVFASSEVVFYVVHGDRNSLFLLVSYGLHDLHVFEFSVLLVSLKARVLEGGDEVYASALFCLVVGQV